MNESIRTERLLLRPLRSSDAELLCARFADWEVIRWLGTPPWPYALGDAHSFIAAQLGRPPAATGYLAITLDGALIGGVEAGSRDATATPSPRPPTLGYWLAQPYWGHGYMNETQPAPPAPEAM